MCLEGVSLTSIFANIANFRHPVTGDLALAEALTYAADALSHAADALSQTPLALALPSASDTLSLTNPRTRIDHVGVPRS